MTRLVGVAFVLATLGGCATTVQGRGARDASTLHCPPGAVTAHGAPFCYVLPDGFTDNSALDTYGNGWTYRSLISVAQYDLVEVLAGRLTWDSDTYSDARLLARAQSQFARIPDVAQTHIDVTPTRVDGARAYQWTTNPGDGKTERSIIAYRGHAEVYIQCLRRDKPQAAQAGCTRVLDTIQIVDLR